MSDVIQTHYQRLAERYDNFLYYSPDFVRQLTSKMIEKLALNQDDVLVDLGCGTGIYSLDILEQVPLKNPVIGVDPFPEMLAQIPEEAPIERVAEDALDFSARPGTYNKILIKETIHHIDDRKALFKNFYQRLAPEGILLLVHVPPNVEYPLFSKALERCLNWHANPDELVSLLEDETFQVERDTLVYRHSLPKEKYFEMVASCYMSVLSSFEEEELKAGLQEMESTYADREILEFNDRFDFITAKKV
ncbi:Methyltransferase type 11 [Nitrosococcus halophilus Nc 4]|uniref:Methyltransferase type 11 n=1 Tax=Nitrosococcus halophilus (strain Nc4) TaxID=472759 RepID=D5BX93_NITHN|nr:class I SAM-dependent methyltransferase [Nitrosococcus halophilus]ADE15776.1 Methyltransferase type 11 [Nitrosococcus halophilus Nc 4]